MFGLPGWAIIAIIAVGGGLLLEYRKQELKSEEKRMAGSKELHELRKIIHGLKSRIEKLERNFTSSKSKNSSSISDIEIDEQPDGDDEDYPQNRVGN